MTLIDSLSTTEALTEIFCDRSVLQAMLDVERALARAGARAGAIPESAALAIADAASADGFDIAAIAREARGSATPTIPVVKALTERVRATDARSAEYVHWGATSQDVTDTAMSLLLDRARLVVKVDHLRLQRRLRDISDAHAGTVMLGRTLLQPAVPITFGLKVAGWYAAANRAWRRLSSAWNEAIVLQFGGAAGTRAAAGDRSRSLAVELARELDLAAVPPWHADRDRLGAFITASALYTAALGKAARDIALLMQSEVAEVTERGGGSSTLPHKRNPSGCTLVIAAAMRMPGLAAAFLGGMVQEHERSAGGSQAEWPTIAAAVQTTGSAVAAMASVTEGLTVDTSRMRSNLEATRGVVFAERAVALLEIELGRDVARSLVNDLLVQSRDSGRTFGDLLRASGDAARALLPEVLRNIDDPHQYLGEAEALRQQLLEDATPEGLERS